MHKLTKCLSKMKTQTDYTLLIVAGLSSHTGKTVENKGTGEKERGKWEKLEGWKLKMNDETRCINWVGREGGIKIFSSITESSFD